MQRSPRPLFFLIIPPVLLILAVFVSQCGERNGDKASSSGDEKTGAEYIGRESCKECHEREYELFQGSDHDLAMDEANEKTVLGNFNDLTIEHFGYKTRFFKRDGRYMVNTEGEGGEFKEFNIPYVFGVRPLQQYLVEFPNGAFQMLPFCWDTRPAEEGGQRWFHIYDE